MVLAWPSTFRPPRASARPGVALSRQKGRGKDCSGVPSQTSFIFFVLSFEGYGAEDPDAHPTTPAIEHTKNKNIFSADLAKIKKTFNALSPKNPKTNQRRSAPISKFAMGHKTSSALPTNSAYLSPARAVGGGLQISARCKQKTYSFIPRSPASAKPRFLAQKRGRYLDQSHHWFFVQISPGRSGGCSIRDSRPI